MEISEVEFLNQKVRERLQAFFTDWPRVTDQDFTAIPIYQGPVVFVDRPAGTERYYCTPSADIQRGQSGPHIVSCPARLNMQLHQPIREGGKSWQETLEIEIDRFCADAAKMREGADNWYAIMDPSGIVLGVTSSSEEHFEVAASLTFFGLTTKEPTPQGQHAPK